jgi:hypothetical protein
MTDRLLAFLVICLASQQVAELRPVLPIIALEVISGYGSKKERSETRDPKTVGRDSAKQSKRS